MKNKRMISLLLLLGGVVLIGFGMYVRYRVNNAKGTVKEVSGWLPDNEVGRTAGHIMGQKVGQYDSLVRWSFIGGTILIAVGLGSLIILRKSRG